MNRTINLSNIDTFSNMSKPNKKDISSKPPIMESKILLDDARVLVGNS